MREYYSRNPKKYRRLKERERERRSQHPAHMIWLAARRRARAAGIEFTISAADLEPVPSHCPALGTAIDYQARGVNNPAAASLDRVDNSKGYIAGNVRIISHRANGLKRDATVEELRALVRYCEQVR